MITIHAADARDFSGLGLGALTPLELEIEEQAGGMFELRMVHPMDAGGKWRNIAAYCILKAPAPVRETPLIQLNENAGETWQVNVQTRLHLRSAPSTDARVIGKYPSGTLVRKLAEEGEWFRVAVESDSASGWMHSEFLTFVSAAAGGSAEIPPRRTREQLFRIAEVEVDDAAGVVRATALHITYDLSGNIVREAYAPEKMPAGQVCAELMKRALNPHEFRLYCTVERRISGDYGRRNIISALLDSEDGVLAQTGANLIRDNMDLFVMKDEKRDRGVQIRHGKNLIGAVMTVDGASVVTRIVPVGEDKDGAPLYLEGDGYVDSPNAGAIPVIRAEVIDYGVQVVSASQANAAEEKYATVQEARARLRELAQMDFIDGIDQPAVGLEVDFAALDQTGEAARYAGLQSIHLYDVVHVISPRSGINAALRMTGYVWDALANGGNGRYISVTLGNVRLLRPLQGSTPPALQAWIRRQQALNNAEKSARLPVIAADDMDALLSGGPHAELFAATAATAGTPYAQGITECTEALILSFASSQENGIQAAFCSGTNRIFTRKRANGVTEPWSLPPND